MEAGDIGRGIVFAENAFLAAKIGASASTAGPAELSEATGSASFCFNRSMIAEEHSSRCANSSPDWPHALKAV
ncbi:MAG: hypothetical protein K0Q57_1040 [Gammaproteobacteria bacterium]|nr:hypothetical protein [Gammaproteobacteria bacterium]